MQEFYLRNENDPKYKDGQFSTSSEDEELFYNVKLSIETTKGDVLGSPDFGTDITEELFTKKVNPQSIRAKIYNTIIQYSRLQRSKDVSIDTSILNDGTKDIIVTNISEGGKNLYGLAFD